MVQRAVKSGTLRLVSLSLVAFAAALGHAQAPGVSFHGDPSAPDISGLWLGTYTGPPGDRPQIPIDDRSITRWAPWPPPLTPPFQKQHDERLAAARAGRAVGDIGARCLPFGMPIMATLKVYPDEIVQTPGVVSLLVFGTFPIMIWTDGRGHPPDLVSSYNGHSIGRWVGDTLHVDTVGILAATPVDAGPRTPHSAKLHMTWTIERVASDVLHVRVTLFDEDAFFEPMVTTNIWRRKRTREWEVLDDQSCFENNRNATDESGVPGFNKF
jgi:hypothetical protein